MLRVVWASGAALVLLCCNAIVGNQDVELQKSGGTGGAGNIGGSVSGGAGGTGGVTGGSGGTSADASDGASGSDSSDAAVPQLIECGSTQCDVQSGYCCVTGTGASTSSSCWAFGVTCNGLDAACDGPEDCKSEAGALLCCASTADGGTKPAHFKCQPSCTSAQWVVCGSVTAACASGTSCKPSPDYPKYNLCL